jgi:hypothetical protein
MKLHGNAALSLNGRRRLVRMVIEQDRSIAPSLSRQRDRWPRPAG